MMRAVATETAQVILRRLPGDGWAWTHDYETYSSVHCARQLHEYHGAVPPMALSALGCADGSVHGIGARFLNPATVRNIGTAGYCAQDAEPYV